jgi:hypothetical protein
VVLVSVPLIGSLSVPPSVSHVRGTRKRVTSSGHLMGSLRSFLSVLSLQWFLFMVNPADNSIQRVRFSSLQLKIIISGPPQQFLTLSTLRSCSVSPSGVPFSGSLVLNRCPRRWATTMGPLSEKPSESPPVGPAGRPHQGFLSGG